jgi:hypothetical protein
VRRSQAVTRTTLLILVALVLLQAPWLSRPPHYDEANFLALAQGAVVDPWRPHDVRINWQGTEQRAFEVLSNPPGIAWWLAPVVDLHVAVQRIWMLPWLGLALWGMQRLSLRFTGDGERGALLLLTSPVVFLATPALLPDAPLLALSVAGLAGFVHAVDRERPTSGWALLLGLAALFRYSAIPLLGLPALYAMRRGRSPLLALPGMVPIVALALHDLHAYGAVHLVEMGRFQTVSNGLADLGHKAVAAVCFVGGVACLPWFRWRPGTVVGAVAGALAASPWGLVAGLFGAAGGAILAAGWQAEGVLDGNLRDQRFLRAWWVGGLIFLLTLRFTAARYWLPFLPALVLCLPTQRWTRRLLAAQLALGVLLAADDDRSARAQEQLATQVARLGSGLFTGHWGWQWQMEARGWRAADEGSRPDPRSLVAIPREAWPQPLQAPCDRVRWEGAAHPPLPWLPRGYTRAGQASLHANWIAAEVPGDPPMRTVIPWTFAQDPYERVRVCQACGDSCDPEVAPAAAAPARMPATPPVEASARPAGPSGNRPGPSVRGAGAARTPSRPNAPRPPSRLTSPRTP